jgi:hypothetical protein
MLPIIVCVLGILRCSRVFLHLSLTKGGGKITPSVSQDLRHLGIKFQQPPVCFRVEEFNGAIGKAPS